MSVELRRLRSFLAVAEQHHFSRGARRLNLAQPPPKLEIHALWRGPTPPATAARWLRMVEEDFA